MPLRLSMLLLSASLLSACGTPAPLRTPDGSSRSAINRSDAMAEYSRGVELDQATQREQTAGTQQLEVLKRDIADLRAYMAASTRQPDQPNSVPTAPTAAAAAPAVPLRRAVPTKSAPKPAEFIRADDQAVMFRRLFANGDARFSPSPFFQQALVKAATEGDSIAIWGATDARERTPASEAIARQRAEAARKFLVSKGVDPAKVKTNFIAAGGFVADNAAPDGQRKNRRVDIEIIKSVKAPPAGQ